MKRVVAVIIVVVWIVNCGIRLGRKGIEPSGKPVFINEDVGDHIDNIERQKYMLFPNIDGFIEAVVYEHPPGWMWEIVTEEERLVALNEDPEAVLILMDYIERHEEIVDSRLEFERTWNIVDYDILGQPITQKEVDRVVIKRRSMLYLRGCGGGSLLGGSLGFFLTLSSAIRDLDVKEHAIIIGAAVGAVAGVVTAQLLNRSAAIRRIKEGRKPRVLK